MSARIADDADASAGRRRVDAIADSDEAVGRGRRDGGEEPPGCRRDLAGSVDGGGVRVVGCHEVVTLVAPQAHTPGDAPFGETREGHLRSVGAGRRGGDVVAELAERRGTLAGHLVAVGERVFARREDLATLPRDDSQVVRDGGATVGLRVGPAGTVGVLPSVRSEVGRERLAAREGEREGDEDEREKRERNLGHGGLL